MKRLLLTLLLCSPVTLVAQNNLPIVNPGIPVCGTDSTLCRILNTDISGNMKMIGPVATGATFPTNPIPVGVSNGGVLRGMSGNSDGSVNVQNSMSGVGGVAVSASNGRQITQGPYPDTTTTSYHAAAKFAGSSTTDNAILPGNATNTVVLTRILVDCTQSTAGNVTITVLKRSAADTGGTSAAMTVVPDDANYAAGVSAPLTFTGTGPTAGAAVGNLDSGQIFCEAAATAAPNQRYEFRPLKPIVLRGVAQGVAINFGGAITGGNLDVIFEWMETTTP